VSWSFQGLHEAVAKAKKKHRLSSKEAPIKMNLSPLSLKKKSIKKEKCLVVHSHLTPIPPSSTWTNNIVKKIGSHYTLSTISHFIGPSRQEWNRSEIRVYNQAFLIKKKKKKADARKALSTAY
jgi:hypothetical protein